MLVIEPKVHGDARGYFLEAWHQARYREAGLPETFVQDNLSFSARGVVRGLHFQHPTAQGKLIHVLEGEIFDVAVDVRLGSSTFGRWMGVTLSGANHRQIYVPEGLAHGFCVTSATALVGYKCTSYYSQPSERCLIWNDPEVGIAWPVENARLSAKDGAGLSLRALADLHALPTFAP